MFISYWLIRYLWMWCHLPITICCVCNVATLSCWIIFDGAEFEGILPKGPYLPCISMAGRALLAEYHRIILLFAYHSAILNLCRFLWLMLEEERNVSITYDKYHDSWWHLQCKEPWHHQLIVLTKFADNNLDPENKNLVMLTWTIKVFHHSFR